MPCGGIGTEKGPGRRSLPGPLQCKYACKCVLAHLSDVSDVGRGDLVLELDAHAGVAGGGDGQIAGLDVAELLSGLDRLDDRAVDGALGNLGLVWDNAPVHNHLLDSPLVAGERADRHVGTEVRDQASGTTGGRRHGDALGANGGSHVHSGHTHNVVDDAGAVSVSRNLERSVSREVLLSLESNAGLHLDGLDRVLTGSGLAREHNGVGAVVDGVSNVGNLGARRARVLLHGVEHLRSGDNGLVGRVALGDDLLLDVRNELGLDLNAQVATGDHDAVGSLENLVEVLDAQGALDLREDRHVLAAVLAAKLADAADGLAVTDEGSGDVVDVLGQAKEDVPTIALGDGGQRDVDVGHVDALALADQAVVLNDAGHVLAVDGLDLEGNQTVIDQDKGALLDLGGQSQVVEGDVLSGAVEILGRGLSGDDDLIAGLDGNLLAIDQKAGADLGALGVEQDADGQTELLGNTTDALDATVVLVVGSVREVKTGDVHARLDHLADGLVAIAGGTHGAYNLGALVHSDLHLTSSCADR